LPGHYSFYQRLELIAMSRSKASSRKSSATPSRSKASKTQDDVYQVEEIIHMQTFKSALQFLVSWSEYDKVTWEPEGNIPKPMIRSFELKIKQHKEKCTIKECQDMVDAFHEGGKPAWLFQVSWSKCTHRTWEREAAVPKRLVAALRQTTVLQSSPQVYEDDQISTARDIVHVIKSRP
jgi:Chromo (CHRromatin Organisation MOdifier) domain